MLIPWILTIIALIGAYYNSQGLKKGFYYWLISNSGFAFYNLFIGEFAMMLLFAIYLIITLNGIRKW